MNDIKYDIGMVGLGVMGRNLLLNMADHGYAVAGFDLSPEKAKSFENSEKPGQKLLGVNTLKDLVASLKSPRKIMLLVPAGKAVDSVLTDLSPLLDKGDIIIDGGNSHYTDTLARIQKMANTGIHFMGVGVSGGEEGARFGPSIMPGGDQNAWEQIKPIFTAISAKVKDGSACVDYMGENAAGHYVKMVHNGIEYAIMQLTTECYDILKNGLSLSNEEIAETFEKWDSGDMKSYLLEITKDIFRKKDDETSNYLIDLILDKAGAKGTGKWTSQSGLDLPMPIPGIDQAVMMRNLSSLKAERNEAAFLYLQQNKAFEAEKELVKAYLQDTLYFSILTCYAQGLAMLTTASEELKMNIPLENVVRVWRGGCIIRSEFLPIFSSIYKEKPNLRNLLLDSTIAERMQTKYSSVQKIIAVATEHNFAIPGIMAAFSYFNAYRNGHSAINLIQAQRDYFGAHTYQRTDREGIFHTEWQL